MWVTNVWIHIRSYSHMLTENKNENDIYQEPVCNTASTKIPHINKHPHTHNLGLLPHSQLLLGCSSALFNHEQSQWSNESQSSLVSFVLCCVCWLCLCGYKKKEPTDRQDSLGSSSLKPHWDRAMQWREITCCKLGHQQELMRLLYDSEAKMCWIHILNCSLRCSLRGANENLEH